MFFIVLILILVSKPIDQIWLVEQTNRPDLASGEIQPDLASGEIDRIWLVEKWTTFVLKNRPILALGRY